MDSRVYVVKHIHMHAHTHTIYVFLFLKLPFQLERERNVLFNDALNTFYLRLYGIRHMVKDHSDNEKETCHIGYSYRLTARVLLYAPSHRQDNTYHGLCYTSRGALAGTTVSIKTSNLHVSLVLICLVLYLKI